MISIYVRSRMFSTSCPTVITLFQCFIEPSQGSAEVGCQVPIMALVNIAVVVVDVLVPSLALSAASSAQKALSQRPSDGGE